MTIAFSKLLAGARDDDGALVLDVPADWMQGRSVFGGLQVAFALQAMRALVPQVALRTLQATFVAPVAGTMRVRARILRTGRNATHVEARIGDDSAPGAIVIAVFGSARSSAVERALVPRKLDPSTPVLIDLPFGTERGPSFIRHFAARWLLGAPPFSGGRESEQILELAIDDQGPANEATIIALADFIPPVAFSYLSAPAAGSTVTWMLEMLVDRVDHLTSSGFRIEAEMVAARDGYTSQAVRLFAASGEPVALSHQSMLVFG
ncbi:MAG TPA: thioesterase family protein [Polyangiales bacterium]|nr:thioesterase family protein [Polyangiales bacterium]